MAFLFGKKKGAQAHREVTPPTGPTATNGPTPSSSLNNSLNNLSNSNAGTPSPESTKTSVSSTKPPTSHQLQQTSPSDVKTTSPPQTSASTQAQQPPPQQMNPANASLYPWSQRRLTLSPSHPSPFPRYGHAANAVAGKEGDIYVMGGLIRGQNVRGDLWMVEGSGSQLAAYPVVTTSEGPGPRVGHASLLVGNAFIVFGGDTKQDERDVLDETLYLLNTSTRQWSRATPSGPRPSGRYGHTLNILGSKLYVFGGQVDNYFFNDLVAFDLNTLQSVGSRWEVLVPAGDATTDVPAPRTNHTMVTWADKLYLFGGTNGSIWFNDVWSYDPRSNLWTQLDCIGYIPSPREGHAAALVNDVMYTFGGRNSEGQDLGDLAAFRISSRRWYTFQNMGPSPSARSGHTMTQCGAKIIILGGEPTTPPRSLDELQLIYLLDTSKIRYPNDQNQSSPVDKSVGGRRMQQGSRNGSTDSAGSGPGPDTRGPPRRGGPGPRENITSNPSPTTPGIMPLQANNTSGGSGSSRLPRASGGVSSQPVGPPPSQQAPPPNQQAPPPRTNGVGPGPRSKTPTGGPVVKGKENSSPMQDGPVAVNGRKTPTSQRKDPASAPPAAPPVQERSWSRQQTQHQNQLSMDSVNTTTTPSSPVQGPVAVFPLSQPQPEKAVNGNNSASTTPGSVPVVQVFNTTPAIVTPTSIINDDDKQSITQEFQKLKQMNDWYASELALARRAGYSPQPSASSLLDERSTDSFDEDERPFVEAMLALKSELAKVQGSVDSQVALAAKKIQEVERQRDVAVQEAVYAKAKLAAVSGNTTSTTGDKGAADVAAIDAEKLIDMNRKLAASLQAQAELSAKLEALTMEVNAERKARQLAEETTAVAQTRFSELDDYRNRAASELESLRAELLDAERAFRDEAAARADATAEAKLLRIDQEELSAKLKEALEDNENYRNSIDELRVAMEATSRKSATLERQTEEERLEKERLERKLAQVKSEYEEKVADLQNANARLRDAEELMEQHAEEARSATAALAAGLAKVADREAQDSAVQAAEQRVEVMKEQVTAANELLAKSKIQADESGEKLAQAMQRVAGLEFQQGQSSKDAIALRRRMAEIMDELRRLKQENVEKDARLLDKQLEIDATSTKHGALKEILAERSSQIGFDKRRSQTLQSPSPHSGTATPEQINRLRELEVKLEESLRAHRETKNSAEMQAQEVEKHFREKLEQLENDYQSAVHYVKGTEKLLKRMKDELSRYKTQNAKLHLDLEEAQRQASGNSRQEGRPGSGMDDNERVLLNREIDDLRSKVRESAIALEKQISETKEQLDTLREERDQFKLQHNQMKRQLMDASQQINEAKLMVEGLESENSMLEKRAQDAEQKVSLLLDQVENSVDAYRRGTRIEGANGVGESSSVRSSYYGADRNSVALDSLATELDALRSHWENTNKNYRLSSTFDFDKTPNSTEGGELSSSLAKWRQKLDEEEAGGGLGSDGEEDVRTPTAARYPQMQSLTAGGLI
ncbi:Negative regulator of mitotic exit [Rhizina undulata]